MSRWAIGARCTGCGECIVVAVHPSEAQAVDVLEWLEPGMTVMPVEGVLGGAIEEQRRIQQRFDRRLSDASLSRPGPGETVQ